MPNQQSLLQFIHQQYPKLLEQTLVHIGLTFISLFIAMAVGISLGLLISRFRRLAGGVLGVAGILQTIPSIALLGFMIPLLGIGAKPAIAALFLYALLPIIRNTYTGITGVDPSILDAARGMGMRPGQVLARVQMPLAMPVILAGIRTATVINVGVATLAAYIAAGGLGEFIFGGIALNNTNMILAGAIPAALLALLLDWLLSLLQRVRAGRLFYCLAPLAVLFLSSFYLLPSAYDGKIKAGFTPEFMGRQDGYLGLRQVYGLHVRTLVINDNVMYNAVAEKKLDVISGSSTDGRVRAFDLAILDDDKHIFPPYYAAPIVRQAVLTKYPFLEGVLDTLSGLINDSIMTELNYRVDCLKETPEDVAKEFLVSRGLYREPGALGAPAAKPGASGNAAALGLGGTLVIGSKIFGDGYILANMYKMLVEGFTNLRAVTKTGLGGTTICFNALVAGQIDLYPEYTGTGLLVILHADPGVLDSLGHDPGRVYAYVGTAFVQRFGIKWLKPIGFNNTYALMMRRGEAQALHIRSISDLSQYTK
ncbi:ABC transporter permease/substrate-binding protein [Dinghuibacter silviterrae]|uniref:Osmoprotectant transport system permease protein n=1 Tax=Dinghuibacter silviterrae TaxID=1539049 RepID=A0A4R8DVC3_9BACT|nr:ABC transporter permease/substrate-binding protein [Dinghuibacter silviterrae]TDX02374.1 osmoprotectant transport system permease protein [Dinghuibacter silviterrae]